jgi:hypothetical protein
MPRLSNAYLVRLLRVLMICSKEYEHNSLIRRDNLTSHLDENSIRDVKQYYICSGELHQESPCVTATTIPRSTTSSSHILVATILLSVIGFILISAAIIAIIVCVRRRRNESFTPDVDQFWRILFYSHDVFILAFKYFPIKMSLSSQ